MPLGARGQRPAPARGDCAVGIRAIAARELLGCRLEGLVRAPCGHRVARNLRLLHARADGARICAQADGLRALKAKKPDLFRDRAFSFEDGVAVTYFRVRKRHTIIGAGSFHGPVRDGKAWFQAAVAAT